jgi:uncharacterized repeat protein (TIGR01451 family)
MRWKLVILGAMVTAIGLAGWAAFAQAQPVPGALPGVAATPAEAPPPPPGAMPPGVPVPPPPSSSVDPVPSPAPVPAPVSAAPLPGTAAVPVPAPAPMLITPSSSEKMPTEAPLAPPATMRPFNPETSVETAVSADNPTGRQEAGVSIEWGGLPVAKVGQVGDYTLNVRNTSNVPVTSVVVKVKMPAGLSVEATEPRHATDGGMLTWDLGTMTARQERVVTMKIKADAKGDLTPVAWVSFTGACAMKLKIREPKLVVKVQAPEKVMVGDTAQFTLQVANPGDGSADAVKVHATLSEGLEHARGNKIDFEIGSLAAGESRNVTLLCATRVGGAQKVDVTAEADAGLKASDACALNVIMPRLDLKLVGPSLRYLDRKARYKLMVTNPGDAAATNVTVADIVPAGFKVLAASHGGRHDSQTRSVSWFLGEVAPGQTREVEMEVQAISTGVHHHKATAVGARGLRAESELTTKVEGVAAMLVELVDTDDPIESTAETSYEVRITNTGSKTETGIKLVATIPDKMQFKNATGPVRYREEGKTVVFETIEKLAPRADAIFRINCKALEQGNVRFKIQVTSDNLTDPVVKMEPTVIYADGPETPAAGKEAVKEK